MYRRMVHRCTGAQVSVVRKRSRVSVAQQHGSLTSGAGRRVQWVSLARPQATHTHRPAVVSPCSPASRGERAGGLLRRPHHAPAARRPTPARPRPAHRLSPRRRGVCAEVTAGHCVTATVSRRLCHGGCVTEAVSRHANKACAPRLWPAPHLPAACHNKTRPSTLSVPAQSHVQVPFESVADCGREGQGGAGAPSGGDGRDSSRARPTPAVGPARRGVGFPGQSGATAARVC